MSDAPIELVALDQPYARAISARREGEPSFSHVQGVADAIAAALGRGVDLVVPKALFQQLRDDFPPDLPPYVTIGPWLPGDFVHPLRVPVPGTALHLRPIREADTALDYPAVMGSQKRLWEIFGPAWGWPPETMTYEEDRIDLLRHEKEIAAYKSFNYALLDEDETAILGCVYIDPPERTGSDGEISWWVVDDLVGSETAHAVDALVPRWIAADWPFRQQRYLGRDISWHEWLALPRAP